MNAILALIEESIPNDDLWSDREVVDNLADRYWYLKLSGKKEEAEEVWKQIKQATPSRGVTHTENDTVMYTVSFPGDRYQFDEALCPNGWVQFDTEQDASHYGIWVNPEKHMIVCFTEGDLHVTVCPRPGTYNLEIDSLLEDPGIQALVYLDEYFDKGAAV